MPPLKIRRIDCSAPKASQQLRALREQFCDQGEAQSLSARDRKLSQAVFGEVLPPARAVDRICADVRDKGVGAVLRYTEQFDKVKLAPAELRVPEAELAAAAARADADFVETVREIRERVTSFQLGILHSSAVLPVIGQHELHLRYRPVRRVGVCVPGGAAAYPSTLLMTVCPAQAAGVKEIAVVMPPTPNGAYNQDMLAVCRMLGVTEVYRMGGAQAVAALAYGVQGVPPVDMIVGPGNLYVTLAKKVVSGRVGIDCLAGPSEVVIVGDASSQPAFIAGDLIAQAEHSADAKSVLVTWHEPLLDQVTEALEKQLAKLDRGELARDSLEKYGAFILTADAAEAERVVNDLSPEHLHVQTRDPEAFADQIDHAGAIFLGAYAPVALGDYAAGPSHVLPTGCTARFSSGLTANDFLKRTSILYFTREGLRDIADEVILLAKKEGLSGHAASIELRVNESPPSPPRPKKAEKSKK